MRPTKTEYKLLKVHTTLFLFSLDSSQATYFRSKQLAYTYNLEMEAAHTPNELPSANHQLQEGSGGSSSNNESYVMGRWLSQSEREEGVVVYAVRNYVM